VACLNSVPSTRPNPRWTGSADRWRPWVLLLAGLLVTAGITYGYSRIIEAEDLQRFGRVVEYSRINISHRFQTHVALLRGGAGLFAARPGVSRREFRSYVQRLRLQTEYPGVQGVGFTRRLAAVELQAFIEAQRADGFTEFRVWPEEPRDEYHAITYLEPQDRRNLVALGYDMFSEPVRREAMARARDTGLPSASGRVTLIQEIDPEKQAGFLIYVPVYREAVIPDTDEGRRAALLGHVYAPFRIVDFLDAIFAEDTDRQIELELFDGPEPNPESLLHRTADAGRGRAWFRDVRSLDVAGRTWTVTFASTPVFEAESKRWLIPFMLALGVLFSALVAGLAFLDARARSSARRLTSYREAVRHGDRLHQLAVEQVKDHAIFMVDPDGRIATWNQGVERVLGWGETEFVGRSIDVIYLPEDIEAGVAREEMRLAARQELVNNDRWHRRKDGTRFWASGTTSSLVNENGAFAGLLVVMRDLTDQQRAAEQRRHLLEVERKAREEAERIGRMKDEFLATLSHELRTPLNAILGWAQILSRGGLGPEQAAKAFDAIARNARLQASIVEDLLDMSRIVSGKVRLEFQPVDAAGAIETALDVIRPAADAKGVRLRKSLPSPLPPVNADPSRLQQILWNLLSNAIKFTPAGGEVRVGLRERPGSLEVSVTDTGQGIRTDFLPHVFERFRQADASTTRSYGGLGLGLSIVKSLVDLHAGSISASSPGEGLGATFAVTLPIASVPADRFNRPRPEPGWGVRPSSGAAPDLRLTGKHVLVVDDHADTRDLVRTILEECGAIVTLTASAPEALEVLRTAPNPPDVLLSDIGMPEMDGYELIRRVRELEKAGVAQVRAVALTALAGGGDRELASRSGFDAHVAKPVDRQQLIEVIGACLSSVA
jgi:PAS domain S-box-containing protein